MPVDPGAEMGVGQPIDGDIAVSVCFFVFCKFLVPSVVCVRARVRACVRVCVTNVCGSIRQRMSSHNSSACTTFRALLRLCHQHVFAHDIHRIQLESINFKEKKMKKIAAQPFN